MQANPNTNANSSPRQQIATPATTREAADQRATAQQPANEPAHAVPNVGEWLTIGFTGVIALMAIAQFIVFRRQWKVMDGQLSTMNNQLAEMKTTTQELDKLVQQATENAKAGQLSAEASKTIAEATKLSADAMSNSAEAGKATAEATRAIAAESKTTAEAALLNAQAVVNAERAWIQVTEVILQQALSLFNPAPDNFFVWFHPYIVNNGRTQARITRIIARADVLTKEEGGDSPRPPQLPEEPQLNDAHTFIERNIILSPRQGITWVNVFITPEDLERIKQRQAFLYVYGRVDYLDLSETERHTGFCKLYWIPYGPTDPVNVEGFVDSAAIPRAYTVCT